MKTLTWKKGVRRLKRLVPGGRRTIRTSAGEAKIKIPRPGQMRSFYLFAMHKSGSTLLNNMMADALDSADVPQISIPDATFGAGLPESDVLNPEDVIFENGYCYRGFREFPPYLRNFDISENNKVLLIRDPRDMLVSNYFSIKHSHGVPRGGPIKDLLLKEREEANSVAIDDYCISQIELFRSEFDGYAHLLNSNTRVYRYEDVIFSKEDWLADMLHYVGVSLPAAEIAGIAREHDVRPGDERPGAHIRQVAPGNFRKHLSHGTISRLNDEFVDVLRTHNYSA